MLNSEEIWKPVKGYENLYFVSNLGNIKNNRRVLKIHPQNSGYLQITFTKEGKRKKFLVHRLVAEAFKPTNDCTLIVNHIDGNKLNNVVNNLEWCTNSENIIHARKLGLNPYNMPTKGIKIGRSSKYRNVSFDSDRKKWIGSIRHNKKTLGQKRFDIEEDAAKHVDYLIDLYSLDRPKNFT